MGEIEDAKVESEFLPVPMPPLDELDELAAGLDRIATEVVTTQEVARRLEEFSAGPNVVRDSQPLSERSRTFERRTARQREPRRWRLPVQLNW